MTISNTDTSVTVQGDGLTTVFNYTFYMGGSSAYASLTYTDENDVDTAISSSAFSITGVTVSTGGTFTYPLSGSPISSGTSLTLARVLPLTQNAAIGNQGNFYPSVVEGALDYQMMVAQQISAAAGTLDAESLYGNNQASSAAGRSIGIGSGLSFSGTTLVVSGVSGSGTVTEVNTGTGLTGGPITGVGTVSMSTITTGYVLANFSGATAAPQGVQLVAGSGTTFSGVTASLTISSDCALLGTATPSGTATVTFSSITSAFSSLRIVGLGRTTSTGVGTATVLLRFNADSGTNYATQLTGGNAAATPFNVQTTGQTSMQVAEMSKTGSIATYGCGFDVTVPFYGNTTFNKAAISHYLVFSGATITSLFNITIVGVWASAAAVTQVELTLSAGNWVAGSQVSLYGLR